MKKQIGTVVCGAIAGVMVFTMFDAFSMGIYTGAEDPVQLGALGGYIAAFTAVGFIWYINHFVGAFSNDGHAWVDMALSIGLAGFIGLGLANGGWAEAIPTIVVMTIGAAIGGVISAMINSNIMEE